MTLNTSELVIRYAANEIAYVIDVPSKPKPLVKWTRIIGITTIWFGILANMNDIVRIGLIIQSLTYVINKSMSKSIVDKIHLVLYIMLFHRSRLPVR